MVERIVPKWSLVWLAVVCLSAPARAGDARIVDVEVGRAGEDVTVSYRLEGALDEGVVERLEAGIPVTYRHRVQWLSRRGFLLLPDRRQSEVVTDVTASYDSLTRTYSLSRVRTTRSRGTDPPPVQEERITADSLATVRSWMTRVDSLQMPPPARPPGGERQVLRITAVFERRMILGMFPSRRSVSVEYPLEP